ncbi:MAG: leucine-rich repeat protein, partial [Prevotella sp.]|nr:leucine-rich repeat protein [Prevotella sp.]
VGLIVSCTSKPINLIDKGGNEIKEYVIPEGVTSIGEKAFYNCSGLTSVTIPNSVTTIGDDAFNGCSGLTAVTIPNSVTTIGDYAFSGCSGLTTISLPDNVKSIKKNSFGNISKVLCKKGIKTLLSLWNAGLIPLEIETGEKLNSPLFSISSTTQESVTIKINNYYEEYTYNYDGYVDGVVSVKDDIISITRMRPNYSKTIYLSSMKISLGDVSFSPSTGGYLKFTTKNISPRINKVSSTASSIQYTGSYVKGDAKIESIYLDGMEYVEGKTLYLKGLNPNKNYYPKLKITVSYGANYEYTYTYESTNAISPDALTLTTQQPKVVSLGNVIVAAESNIDDEEENVGFEWRRTDWTDDFASNTGTANMFEGTMEGYIRNLNTEKLWKFRPYYLADDGTYFYGDWVGLDPTNTSYFEPTVHTYAKIEVKGNTALVKGYALDGSDKITVQGFKYWKKVSANNRAASDIPSDAMTIEAKGTVMEVSLTDLEYASSYEYVAFATTSEGDTFYGEIKTFETGESPVTPGDANGDGVVNVTDIVEIVNDILGHPSAKFDKTAADVNGDGVVNVTDIVSVVNIILSSNARELTNRAAATNNLKLSGGSIKLRNAENYTAAQFDIHLTDGSTVNYLSLNSTSDHQMTWQMVDANTCRVIVYSLSNSPFRAVKDELFNVTLSGNATISNELLVNVDSMVTGINEMQFDKPVNVYDLRGNKVRSNTTDLNGLQKGVYIVNGKKVVVK